MCFPLIHTYILDEQFAFLFELWYLTSRKGDFLKIVTIQIGISREWVKVCVHLHVCLFIGL